MEYRPMLTPAHAGDSSVLPELQTLSSGRAIPPRTTALVAVPLLKIVISLCLAGAYGH